MDIGAFSYPSFFLVANAEQFRQNGRYMNLDTLGIADLLKETMEIAREQGVTTRTDWRELVNVVVDGHLDIGELNKDQDLQGMKQALVNAWDEYVRMSAPETKEQVNEDPDAPVAPAALEEDADAEEKGEIPEEVDDDESP